MVHVKEELYAQYEGQEVLSYTFTNSSNGATAKVINFGATLMSLKTPDKFGVLEEVTLNQSSLDDLLNDGNRPYYGCTVGRFANRIALGKFKLNDKEYQLAVNNGVNHLHGGIVGYDRKIWNSRIVENDGETASVEFTLFSADTEENYPGNVNITVIYSLNEQTELSIDYRATTDQATPINLTNHTYWNLSGNLKNKVYSHRLNLNSEHYLPVDETQIPTGVYRPVKEDPLFDFTKTKDLKESITTIDGGGKPGLDHCFIISTSSTHYEESGKAQSLHERLQQNTHGIHYVGTLSERESGKQMIVFTTQPGVQIYTANWLPEDSNRFPHIQHNAICMETQHFPDSINQSHFPSVVLQPNQVYHHKAVFAFSLLD